MRLILLIAAALCALPCIAQPIYTLAGSGVGGYGGDGGAAPAAKLNQPVGIAIDGGANVYIADRTNNRVRRVSPTGIITTVAGTGAAGYSGDGGPATAAEINNITGVAADAAGNVYIADKSNHCVRQVSPTGIINTMAGTGIAGYGGDGGPATAAQLSNPWGIAADGIGNIYVAEQGNKRVRKIDAGGIITTVAGNGTAGFSGDGGPATAAQFDGCYAVAVDVSGNIYISDVDNQRIRRVSRAGIITTVAGSGVAGYCGDGGPATAAALYEPIGIAIAPDGTLYIADGWNNRIRAVNADGTIHTIAGTGTAGFSGDGALAVSAELHNPYGIAVSSMGSVLIGDNGNNRVRYMSQPSGVSKVLGDLQVSVYPNPSAGAFSIMPISSAPGIVTLTMCNTAGQVVNEWKIPINKVTDVEMDVPAGAYFLTTAYWRGVVIIE